MRSKTPVYPSDADEGGMRDRKTGREGGRTEGETEAQKMRRQEGQH